MDLDYIETQPIERALENFSFLGYAADCKPKTTTYNDETRVTIEFRKINSKNTLGLCLICMTNHVQLSCDYTDVRNDDVRVGYFKSFDLLAYGGGWSDLNRDVDEWVAKLEKEIMTTKLDNKMCQNSERLLIDKSSTPYEQNKCDEMLPSPIGRLFTESDAKLTARLMNEYGLVFTEDNPINNALQYEPPFTERNIIDWFNESYYKLLALRKTAIDMDGRNSATYVNGPLRMRADKNGCVNMSISLVENSIFL